MEPLSPLAEEVRRHDRDRFVTALFAPPERREALFALYAFSGEIARIREVVSEPLLGEMRLQWWRDALATIYDGGDLAHPVARGLRAAIGTHRLTRATFERLIEARAADLVNGPPDTLGTLEAYAAGTASSLVELALEVLGARGEAARTVAHHAGIGWALVGLMRAVPFHAAAGRIFLPRDLMAENGVTPDDVLDRDHPPPRAPSERPPDARYGQASGLSVGGSPSPLRGEGTKKKLPPPSEGEGRGGGDVRTRIARVAETLALRAREHLRAARSQRDAVPREARSALLATALAETYLGRLARARYDLFDPRWSMTRPAVLRLTILAALGRY